MGDPHGTHLVVRALAYAGMSSMIYGIILVPIGASSGLIPLSLVGLGSFTIGFHVAMVAVMAETVLDLP